MDDRVQTISTFHLVYELLAQGRGELYPELEPISTHAIVDALHRRHGCNWRDNVDLWVEWFLNSPDVATAEERETIATVARIKKIEQEALRRIKEEGDS